MRTFALLLAFATTVALVPVATAIEPQGGPPSPWILQGTVLVEIDGEAPAPCIEPSAATIYTWVQAFSANFQLSVLGGCDPIATVFYGTGDIWEGFELGDFVVPMGTSGSVSTFFEDPVRVDLRQTLPDGRSLRVSGDFVVVF